MSAKKAAKKAPAKKAVKKAPAKKAPAKKAAKKAASARPVAGTAGHAKGNGEKITAAIAAEAARKVVVIPPSGFVSSMGASARRGAPAGMAEASSAPRSLEDLLASRKGALAEFAAQAMQSAKGIATSLSAAPRTSRRATASSAPVAGVKILEGLGALVMDRSAVDVNALAASTGATVLENLLIPLQEPVQVAAAAADLPDEAEAAWHLAHINVDAARQKGLTGQGVRIGILDTGIDADHGEFAGKNVAFARFDMNGDIVGTVAEDTGDHGTHVSGIAAGVNVGVAPDADLAVAAVLTYLDDNGTNVGYFAQIAAGLNWLLSQPFDGAGEDPGVDVLNASLGGTGYRDYLYGRLATARTLTGTVLAASIGNAGRNGINQHGSPGNYDIVAGVGALDDNNAVASFSDWGTVSQHGGLAKPDLCAPGVGIWSSVPGGGYESMDGTSMASPVVAGALALLLQKYPDLDLDAPGLLERLYALVRPISGSTKRKGGRGSLDLTGI